MKRQAEEEEVADVDVQNVPEPVIVPKSAADPEPQPEPEPVAVAVKPADDDDDDALASKPVKKRRSGRKRIAESVDAADVEAMLELSKPPVRTSSRRK